MRDEVERRKRRVDLNLDFIQCFNDGESVVIEAEADGETADGLHYNSPAVFIFETRDGLIASLREYSDTQLAAGIRPGEPLIGVDADVSLVGIERHVAGDRRHRRVGLLVRPDRVVDGARSGGSRCSSRPRPCMGSRCWCRCG